MDRAPVWIALPVKPLAEGKSRLNLPSDERWVMNAAFLQHVLGVACGAVPARRVVVVSRDEAVLASARRAGARALRERDGGDLNDALSAAAWFARARGAGGVLSVFADLPYLTLDDLRAMIRAYAASSLVIAPDRAGSGSNALLMPPCALPYRHGADSFWHHLAGGRDAGLDFTVVRRPGLMNDVDRPDDLAALSLRLAELAGG